MKVLAAGEVMIELFAQKAGGLQKKYAGDTLNAAVYMSRQGIPVEYYTILGTDPFSSEIINFLAQEKIGSRYIRYDAQKLPGLYIIQNDDVGERDFYYWRENSAARALFSVLPHLEETPDYFYFSGITLAVAQNQLSNLLFFIQKYKNKGCQIVFDTNYRSRLWSDPNTAIAHYRKVIPYVDMLFSSMEDERSLWGHETPSSSMAFYQEKALSEIIIRDSDLTTYIHCQGKAFQSKANHCIPVDTTGAGDSFNGTYLACRAKGASIEKAVLMAQLVSSKVVMHSGAIIES